jgi:nucleotide-binding universal stress UspA family protein
MRIAPDNYATHKRFDCCQEKAAIFKRLLVAVDGSEKSEYAVDCAASLAGQIHAELVLVHVFAESQLSDSQMGFMEPDVRASCIEAAEALLARLQSRIPADIKSHCVLCEGDPATEIVSASISQDSDMIIMGTHARGPLARAFLGSVARRVTLQAICPVLTIAHAPVNTSISVRRQ